MISDFDKRTVEAAVRSAVMDACWVGRGGYNIPDLLELALAEFRGGLSATGTIAPISKASVSVILAALNPTGVGEAG